MITYKVDILKELEENGYTLYRIKKEKILGGSTVDKLRAGQMIGMSSLEKICDLLGKQPGNLIENR